MSTKKPRTRTFVSGLVAGAVAMAAILAGILAAMHAYDWLSTIGKELTAEGEGHTFAVPQEFVDELRKASNDVNKKEGARYLSFDVNMAVQKVIITNNSLKEIETIKLETDTIGFFRLEKPGEDAIDGKFKNNIPIGSLRPSNSATVYVWANGISDSYFSNFSKITHPDGVVKIDHPVLFYDTWSLMKNSIHTVISIITVVLLSLFLIWFMRTFSNDTLAHASTDKDVTDTDQLSN